METARQLVRELIRLRRACAPQALDVHFGNTTTTFSLEGEVVGIHATQPSFSVGRILVRSRHLTREQYIDVLQRVTDGTGTGHHFRFGEIAVGLGYVKAEDLAKALLEQMRWPAVRLFLHAMDPSVRMTWTRRDLFPFRDRSSDAHFDAEAIFLDAVRSNHTIRRTERAWAPVQALSLAEGWDIEEVDARFDLDLSAARFVREVLAGGFTVDEICTKDWSGVHTRAIVEALLATGAAEARLPALPRSLPPPAARPPRPIPQWALVHPTMAKDAAAKAILARGASAPDGPAARFLKAEQSFKQARDLFSKGEVELALPVLESLLTLDPTNVEADLLVRWIRLWMQRKGVSADDAVDLEHRSRTALANDPDLAFAQFLLGEALQVSGRPADAREHLTHAIRLDRELLEGIRDHRLGTRGSVAPSFTSASDVGERGAASSGGPAISSSKPSVGGPLSRQTLAMRSAPPIPMAPPLPTIEMSEAATAESKADAPPPAVLRGRRAPQRVFVVAGGVAIVVAGTLLGVLAANWDLPQESRSGVKSAEPLPSTSAPPPTEASPRASDAESSDAPAPATIAENDASASSDAL